MSVDKSEERQFWEKLKPPTLNWTHFIQCFIIIIIIIIIIIVVVIIIIIIMGWSGEGQAQLSCCYCQYSKFKLFILQHLIESRWSES